MSGTLKPPKKGDRCFRRFFASDTLLPLIFRSLTKSFGAFIQFVQLLKFPCVFLSVDRKNLFCYGDTSINARPWRSAMDSVALIIGSLAAGAAAAAKETASQVVKDSYAGLKSLILRRFEEKKTPYGEVALAKYEEKPRVWEEPLKDALKETEAETCDAILDAVKLLREVLEKTPEGREAISKHFVNVQNSHVGVVGDHATIGKIHFGNRRK
jgi:hypothetical protein